MANKEVDDWFGEQIKEKSKGRNHDLSVAEYKMAQETKHLNHSYKSRWKNQIGQLRQIKLLKKNMR